MDGLKNRLISCEVSHGSWLTIGHTVIAELIANSGYFDWLTIDMEHSAITISQAQDMIRIIELSGVTPLVRVGKNDPYQIKSVMDAGAHGVIVPMVNSKIEAEEAVAAVKYPPHGTRGVGLARAQGYGFSFEEYKKWLEEESIIIVQIEHIKAIENLESILKVPGVDGSIIGPYDLSGSLGCPGDFKQLEMLKALKEYESICNQLKKPKGVHIVQPDVRLYKEYRVKDYSFIAVGLDTLFLGTKINEVMGAIE